MWCGFLDIKLIYGTCVTAIITRMCLPYSERTAKAPTTTLLVLPGPRSSSYTTTTVPIFHYVTIEMINYVQASYIDNDLEMYDDEDDVPALARTSNMNADLGMIAHIFSDKTGTLTRNIMEFKKCACAGQIYEKGATLR